MARLATGSRNSQARRDLGSLMDQAFARRHESRWSIRMDDNQKENLAMYVNDMIGLERDIIEAIDGQLNDERIFAFPDAAGVLGEVVRDGKARIEVLKEISEECDGVIGGKLKEAAMAVAGTMAAFYGKLREHPASRMLRDDVVALNVAVTSYSMLLTLAQAVGHTKCADLAGHALRQTAPQVTALAKLLPVVVEKELADDGPITPGAAAIAVDALHEAWRC